MVSSAFSPIAIDFTDGTTGVNLGRGLGPGKGAGGVDNFEKGTVMFWTHQHTLSTGTFDGIFWQGLAGSGRHSVVFTAGGGAQAIGHEILRATANLKVESTTDIGYATDVWCYGATTIDINGVGGAGGDQRIHFGTFETPVAEIASADYNVQNVGSGAATQATNDIILGNRHTFGDRHLEGRLGMLHIVSSVLLNEEIAAQQFVPFLRNDTVYLMVGYILGAPGGMIMDLGPFGHHGWLDGSGATKPELYPGPPISLARLEDRIVRVKAPAAVAAAAARVIGGGVY